MYAHVTGDQVDQVGDPPRLTFTGGRWWDLRTLDPDALAACSWWPVTEAPRPADTPTTTWDVTWTLVGGTVVQGWVERPKTAQEIAAEQAQAQREATRAAVRAIVDDLKAEKARAQAILDTANATINAGPAPYVKDAARAAKRTADAAIDLARFVRDSGA